MEIHRVDPNKVPEEGDPARFTNPAGACPDWIWASASNVSLAKNRESFFTYTPFRTMIPPIAGGKYIKAVGIGDVAVRIKCPASSHANVVIIREVLHVPDGICNIIGDVFTQVFPVTDFAPPYTLQDRDGNALGMLEHPPGVNLFRLVLEPRSEISFLEPGGAYALSVAWQDRERKRWQMFKDGDYALAGHEMEWLSRNGYKNEFTFLRQYGHSIYDDEDRQEGRKVLRRMISLSNEC